MHKIAIKSTIYNPYVAYIGAKFIGLFATESESLCWLHLELQNGHEIHKNSIFSLQDVEEWAIINFFFIDRRIK